MQNIFGFILEPSKDGKGESGDGSSSDGNEEIEKIVTDMLDQYDSDKTGKIDFALESAGISITYTYVYTPITYTSHILLFILCIDLLC